MWLSEDGGAPSRGDAIHASPDTWGRDVHRYHLSNIINCVFIFCLIILLEAISATSASDGQKSRQNKRTSKERAQYYGQRYASMHFSHTNAKCFSFRKKFGPRPGGAEVSEPSRIFILGLFLPILSPSSYQLHS